MTSKKLAELIEREGAAYIVGMPDFITTSEVLAVEAAHAYASAEQEWFHESPSLRNKPCYYPPTIYRVPLNTTVLLDQCRLYERAPLGEVHTQSVPGS